MAPSRGSVCGQLLWCLRGSGSVVDSSESSPTGRGKSHGQPEGWNLAPGTASSSSTPSNEERISGTGMKGGWPSAVADNSAKSGLRSKAQQASKGNRVVPLGSGAAAQGAGRSPLHQAGVGAGAGPLSGGAAGVRVPQDAALHPRRPSTDLISAIDSFAESTVQPGQNSVTGGRLLTGEELHASGFKLYYPGNVAPPGSSVSLAFLVLDVTLSGAGTGAVHAHRPSRASVDIDDVPTSAHARSGSARHRLVPMFTNSSCRAYFKISDHADYVSVIRKLLKRDPLLSFALQKAVRHLKAGDAKPVNHVTPDPSGQSSSLCGVRLTPCVWRHEGSMLPALMVEHNLPYDTDVVMPRLMRDYAVLSHVPAILTMIDFQGRVLYQNASSLEYLGDLLSIKYDSNQPGLLQVLYMYDLGSLEEMLDHVLMGQEWQGVVQVPSSMRRHLGHQQDSDTVIDFMRNLGADGARGGGVGGVEGLNDDEDQDFHIGDALSRIKKQHQRAATAFLMKHGSVGPAPRGSADDGIAGGNGDRIESVTSARDETPLPGVPGALQQRRFMSLIDTKQAQHGGSGDDEDDAEEAGEGSDYGSDDADPECYHEVHAIPLLDPVLDKQVIMLVQTDVTPRVELENKLADLTDAQLSMLEQLFPRHIIEYMLARVPSRVSRNLRDLANTHEKVMVLFCDVVGFTSMSKEVEASQVMHFLNELYEAFDNLVDDYGMYKLDIVGDCYIVVAGLIKEDQDGFVCVDELDDDQVAVNAVRIMQFAKAMLRESLPVLMPHNSEPVSLRIGIHTGPLVSGLVGSKMPKFTLFGDTMNTASRMESTCRPGCIHVSDAFSQLLPHEEWESTGGVQVKGKGLMSTYLWSPGNQRKDALDQQVELAGRSLRKNMTLMQSFTSHRSRLSALSSSTRKRDSDAGMLSVDREGREPAVNPLMAILHNIRGTGGDDDAMSEATAYTVGGSGSGALLRPKSGRVRMPMAGRSHANLRLQDGVSSSGAQPDAVGMGGGTRRFKRMSESTTVRASPTGVSSLMGGDRPGGGGGGRARLSMEGGTLAPGGGPMRHGSVQRSSRSSRKSDSGALRNRDRSRSRDLGDGTGDEGLITGLRELVAARRASRQSSSGASRHGSPSRTSSRSGLHISTSGAGGRTGAGAGTGTGQGAGPGPGSEGRGSSRSRGLGPGAGPGPGSGTGGVSGLDHLDLDDSPLQLAPVASPTASPARGAVPGT